MLCPKCGHDTKVVSTVAGNVVERHRRCLDDECRYTFLTIEIAKYDASLKSYVAEIIKLEKIG